MDQTHPARLFSAFIAMRFLDFDIEARAAVQSLQFSLVFVVNNRRLVRAQSLRARTHTHTGKITLMTWMRCTR